MKVTNQFARVLSQNPKKLRVIYAFLFLLIIIPALGIAVLSYLKTKKDLTDLTLSRRSTIAYLSAVTLKERLDHLVSVGKSYASGAQFRELVVQKKWEEAVSLFDDVPKDFPAMDLIFLVDTSGIPWAYTPKTPNYASIVGQDFSFRDWYQGVSKNWEPFVSEVFQRAPTPQVAGAVVAVPVKDETGTPLGILGFFILTETFLDWSNDIDVGPDGFVFFTDRKGHLAAHPKYSSKDGIIDFSSALSVQKALSGKNGVETNYNEMENEERLVAYQSVPEYGWIVVATQPAKSAFASRDAYLRSMLILYSLIFLASVVVAYFFVMLLRTINAYRQKEAIFLESIGDGVVAIDREWNITLWNKAAEHMTGRTWQEAVGKPFREYIRFIRERDRKEDMAFIEEVMATGNIQSMKESTLLVKKNGQEISVGDSAAPIVDQQGKTVGAIIIFRDVTQEREAQMVRSNFAYASHQLRTPVSKALFSLELTLSDIGGKSPFANNLQIAYTAVKNIRKVVNDLVELAEIDQGTVIPRVEKVNIQNIIKEVIRDVQEQTTTSRSIILKGFKPHILLTSSELLRRILFSVVYNAVVYNRPKGKVAVCVTPQSDGTLIEIKDGGIGISEEQQPLIFTKFFRGANIPDDSIGAGLSLFIAREYVRLLGGKIWFTSEVGKGTTFFVFLPSPLSEE